MDGFVWNGHCINYWFPVHVFLQGFNCFGHFRLKGKQSTSGVWRCSIGSNLSDLDLDVSVPTCECLEFSSLPHTYEIRITIVQQQCSR